MKYDMGLYDSANGKSLKALKVVDVTKDQGRSKVARLAFARAERGRIVQLESDGARIHYFMDEPSSRRMMEDDCDRFGFQPHGLVDLADKHAPRAG